MKILVATSNPHKLEEIRAIMVDAEAEIISLNDLALEFPEPVEDQDTFEGNAVLKAKYYAERTQMLCMADDSGLEVDILNGEPGVLSARYSGKVGPRKIVDWANNKLLLQKMKGMAPSKRTGRFVCAMALCDPKKDKPLVEVRGTIEGRILTLDECDDVVRPEKGKGDNGFGYDPIFFVPGLGMTTAELTADQKNRVSHRGAAAREMARQLVLIQKTQMGEKK
ncbi:RdgB/HAM1 family non-canonical purine NTP pyrophosphatase [Poriferisphaera sp. WC338]|uniref:RdgB/HAM1 family non-canonical purine NTP pyrophosphatase n=1 Tax=Poriferisphaera sp. WC338 TaxID=3425129 RepID=UPI003D815ABC